MMTLFAHHVELYHLPVLTVLFAAGAWIGWTFVSALGKQPQGSKTRPGA